MTQYCPRIHEEPKHTKKQKSQFLIPEESMLHFHVSSTAAFLLLHPFLIQACLCKGVILPKIRAIVLHWNLTHISQHNDTANWDPLAGMGTKENQGCWLWCAFQGVGMASTSLSAKIINSQRHPLEIPCPIPPSKFTVKRKMSTLHFTYSHGW